MKPSIRLHRWWDEERDMQEEVRNLAKEANKMPVDSLVSVYFHLPVLSLERNVLFSFCQEFSKCH
jgi:hypothetical protein